MNTHDIDIELPPLPEPFTYTRPGKSEGALFHVGHMRDYARAAVEADRKRRGEPVAWLTPGMQLLFDNPEGFTDWKPLFAAPQPAEPCVAPTLHNAGSGAQNGIQATQPAEPVKTDSAGYTLGPISDGGMGPRNEPAEPVKVPSDAELENAWDRFEAEMARQPTGFDLKEFIAQFADEQGNIADDRHAEAARAVLSDPVGEVFTMEPLDGSGDVRSHVLLTKPLPAGTKLYVGPVAAQAQPVVNQQMTTAARDVLAERQRQVEAEGWTTEHDDSHHTGEIALAAGCYAMYAHHPDYYGTGPRENRVPRMWPWAEKWWKQASPRRNLVKAGALILAEIERLDRAAKGE